MIAVGKRWTWAAGVVGVTAAVAVPILGLAAARTLGDSTAGVLDAAPASQADPSETPGALLVTVDGNDVIGLTVLALEPSGAGGTAVVVPAGSTATVDGFDHPTRLAAAYTQGGMDAQVTATEGLLGVTFSAAEQVDAAGLRTLLAPLGPIPVDLAEPVVRKAGDGAIVLQLPAGPQELSTDQAVAVLFTRTPSESEVARLHASQAVWSGIVAAADRAAAPAPDAAPTDVAGYLAAIGAGPRQAVLIDGTPALDAVTNPDGIDLLELDTVGVRLLMARILPSAASPTGSGLRVRLVDHTGDATALYRATAGLQLVGANVVAVDDAAGGPVAKTTSVLYDPALAANDVESLKPAVGTVTVGPADERIDGVDVTIELGQDFLTFLQDQAGAAGGGVAPATAGG